MVRPTVGKDCALQKTNTCATILQTLHAFPFSIIDLLCNISEVLFTETSAIRLTDSFYFTIK